MEEVRVPGLQFLGPQDGPVEARLKAELVTYFRSDGVVKLAYLARAQVKNSSDIVVVLGIRAVDAPNMNVVAKVGEIFAAMFSSTQHIDIMFLKDEDEAAVSKVCAPFFDDRSR